MNAKHANRGTAPRRHIRRLLPVLAMLFALALAACGGGGGGGSNDPGTGSTDCVLDTSAKLDSCKLG